MDNQNYNLNYEANYNPNPAPAAQPNNSKKPAITAMVFGILSLSLGCIPYIGSIIGLVFGIIGNVKCKKQSELNVPQTYGFLKAGKICSLIGIILSALLTLLYLILLIMLLAY